MARSMWKGAISFGLVHIPVEMYTAVSEHSLDLTMLDKRDFSPIGFKRYNKNTQAEVAWEHIVKGYEYQSGDYVVLSDEDLRRANVDATQTIDILAFVDAEDVPLIYYDQPYYLAPGKGGDKVYALLRETLRKTGKIGIATVVIRVKQHLCALVCVDDVIVMNTLRFSDEIRSTEELKIPKADTKHAAVSDKEIKMATALVEGMSEKWDPAQYHDTYKEDVMEVIHKKIAENQTKTITMPDKGERAAASSSNVIDLVALLQQSLGKKPGKGGKPAVADDDDGEEAAPAPRKRGAKAATADEDEAPAPKRNARAATDDDEDEPPAPRKRTKAAADDEAPAARKRAAAAESDEPAPKARKRSAPAADDDAKAPARKRSTRAADQEEEAAPARKRASAGAATDDDDEPASRTRKSSSSEGKAPVKLAAKAASSKSAAPRRRAA